MANLRVNKITGTEVFETTGSVQFDGSGDYLSLSSSSDFAFGTGDFTIEMWVYHTNLTGQQTYFGDTYGSTAGVYTYKTSNNEISLYDSAQRSLSAVNLISANTWHHIAWTRQSGTLRAFINGSLVDSDTYDGNFTTTEYYVGDTAGTSSGAMSGHISNLRVLKGTALYTKNFTPPTRELTVIPNTVLLCCQSTTRANEERTGKTITVNGNAVANELTPGLLTDRIRSGGSSSISGSVEFDGTGDYLSLSDSSDFDIGLNNQPFTWEVWFNMTSPTSVTNNLGLNRGGGVAGWNSTTGHQYQAFYYTDNKLYWQFWNGTTNVSVISDANLVAVGSWNHFAVTYDGTTTRGFLNGIQFSTTSTSNYAKPSSSNITRIGTEASGSNFGNKFLSNIRVINGTALYTQNFIPPTRELKNLPGTVLLCCQNSKSATQEATGKTITVNGNATARNFTPSVGFDGTVTFDGVTKINSPNYFYLPTGNTEDRGRGRGLFGGGYVAPTVVNTIDYISISNTGNAIDFGDMITPSSDSSALGSSTRGVVGGISTPTTVNTIEYITFASTSNSFDFGDLTVARWGTSTASNTTRGIFYSGYVAPANINVIDYITIASIGNATDFGDAITAGRSGDGCSSPIRGIFASGVSPSANTIEYITISSTGNSQDFGDLTVGRIASAASSSSTRAIFAGGYVGPAGQITNTIDYITISSTGNAQDFGDLTRINWSLKGLSNSIRGIIGGGYVAPVYNNNIDYVTISSTGNSQDFGDMTSSRGSYSACSDSHGGLG